jgi:uncharacterized protein involved in response to NO
MSVGRVRASLPQSKLANGDRNRIAVVKGYRAFFLGAALFALVAIAVWLAMLERIGPSPLRYAPAQWHAHEMLFGYVAAVVAGFLLLGTSGWRVGVLCVLWLAGRLAMASAAPAGIAAAIDLAFLPALALLRMPPLWVSFKWPTFGFLPLLGALLVGNLLWHLDQIGVVPGGAERGELLALDLFVLMMVVMAGRLVPGYTRAMLIPLRHPKDPWRERWSIGLGVVLLLSDQLGRQEILGVAAIALGALQAWRLAGWRTADVLRRPLLLVLHVGFAWLVFGLVLRGVAELTFWISRSDALHATTVGAIGTLTLGMMGRLARSQGRRKLTASAVDVASYALLFAAGITRVFWTAVAPDWRQDALATASVLWALAFGLFLAEHGRSLVAPRRT